MINKILLITALLLASFMVWGSWENDGSKAIFVEEFTGSYDVKPEATGQVKEIELIAAPSDIELMSGVKTQVWAYNNQVPGPEIRVKKGDTVRAKLINNLPQPTTIHWHGVRVPNRADGVPVLTQDPVLPGQEFIYEFTPPDAGTFWFHPHVRGSEQVERGLYGTLIVEESDEQKFSQDIVAVVDDWLLDETAQVYPVFNTPNELMHDGRWGNVIITNGQQNYSINAKPGERVRVRLVNTSNGRPYKLAFGDLEVTTIAVDGMRVGKEVSPEGFIIAPGNRVDVDVKLPLEKTASNLAITDNYFTKPNNLINFALNGDPVSTPNFNLPFAHVPDWEAAQSAAPDFEYQLTPLMQHMNIAWALNGRLYDESDSLELQNKEFYKIRFRNRSARLHPMHLHGQFFKVLNRSGIGGAEPFWRDTVLVMPHETVEIGLVPLDRGRWALHCHILEHAESGMMTSVKVN